MTKEQGWGSEPSLLAGLLGKALQEGGGGGGRFGPGWETPLFAAVRLGREDLAAALLKAGAEPDAPAFGDRAPPIVVAAKGRLWGVVAALLDAGGRVFFRTFEVYIF